MIEDIIQNIKIQLILFFLLPLTHTKVDLSLQGSRKWDHEDPAGPDKFYLVGQNKNLTHAFYQKLAKLVLFSPGLGIHVGQILQKIEQSV